MRREIHNGLFGLLAVISLMIPYKVEPVRVVSSYAGPGTGETIYVAEDGSEWTNDQSKRQTYDATMPQRTAKLIGNKLYR